MIRPKHPLPSLKCSSQKILSSGVVAYVHEQSSEVVALQDLRGYDLHLKTMSYAMI